MVPNSDINSMVILNPWRRLVLELWWPCVYKLTSWWYERASGVQNKTLVFLWIRSSPKACRQLYSQREATHMQSYAHACPVIYTAHPICLHPEVFPSYMMLPPVRHKLTFLHVGTIMLFYSLLSYGSRCIGHLVYTLWHLGSTADRDDGANSDRKRGGGVD